MLQIEGVGEKVAGRRRGGKSCGQKAWGKKLRAEGVWEKVAGRRRGEIQTHVLFSVTFFFAEKRVVYELMWKYIVQPAGHRWQCTTAHAHCMLVTRGYKRTLRI